MQEVRMDEKSRMGRRPVWAVRMGEKTCMGRRPEWAVRMGEKNPVWAKSRMGTKNQKEKVNPPILITINMYPAQVSRLQSVSAMRQTTATSMGSNDTIESHRE